MTPEPPSSPVFYDPSGARWRRFLRLSQSAALAFALLFAVFLLVAISLPQLPVLGLPLAAPVVPLEVANKLNLKRLPLNVPYRIAKPTHPVRYVRSLSPVIRPRAAAKPTSGKPLVWGYYVNWDPASMVSLRLHLNHLTHLVPEWLVLQNAAGDIDDQSDSTAIAIARQANLPIYAMLTNYRNGDWQSGDVRKILGSAARRHDLIENIRANLAEHKFAGVNIDFEQLTARDRQPLLTFMVELTATLHKSGYVVSEDVPVEDDAYDIRRLAAVADFLVPMIYDEHYETGPPGPVASETFFENELDKVAKLAPPSKLIAGFGNYGYDWIIGGKGASEVAFDDVMAQAAESKTAVAWDAQAENPVLRFRINSQQHEVWFLDAVTALNQILAVNDDGFRGVGLWRLGGEDPGLWNVLPGGAWPADNFPVDNLSPLLANQSAPRNYGSGEILHVSQTPHDGRRTVLAPPKDQDFRETYSTYPTPFIIDHTGATDRKLLCLTFDDGPDPRFTPAILDILKQRRVPATFFVIGVNAEENPSLIKREYADGHEIGNHTYTHPNIAATSPLRTELELSTTQRIIENLLGVSTTFFRPPYNADSEPTTPQEIEPILRAQNYGYATVSETVDPRDWEPGISAKAIRDEIDSEIASSISEGDEASTHVILLHDAGGDRRATVEALPEIIAAYRAKGYTFAPVSDLIGKDRAQVMPHTTPEELRLARIEGSGLDAKARGKLLLGILFLSAIFATMARTLLYGLLAVVQKYRSSQRHLDPAFQPPVSVLIAAYNEEKVIVRTVESILADGYDDVEIVIVDDGSKDRTLQVLEERFAADPKITILSQANAGKSAALNHAIRQARHELLVAVDADTLFRPGTIHALTRHFADPNVGAVSGNARVGNRQKWITRFQSIEYIYGFNLDRRALDLLNAITVVPGAVGAWRKSLVIECGGFLDDTLAEDTDLTLAIRRRGSVIRYEADAIAYTEAPEDTRSLLKQRFRWVFGTLQAAWKHRDALFVPRYGTLGFIALPSIWLFQVFLSALAPFAEIAMVVSLFAGNWRTVLLYYFAFFAVELLSGFVAYALEGLPPWDLSLLFFQTIYYRQLMLYVLGKSFLFAIRGRLVGWGKLERKATVTVTT